MKVLLQRVLDAKVVVEEVESASIGYGLLVFLGVAEDDVEVVADKLASKVLNLRMFDGDSSKFDKSLLDVGGEILVVSQFTLFAETHKGRRPKFFKAAKPDKAKYLYDYFCEKLLEGGAQSVKKGPFATRMIVDAKNLGPFSVPIEVTS